MVGRKIRKVRRGVVLSNKMDKSVVVLVENPKLHPVYHKYIKRGKKFMAHDEKQECQIGDIVDIVETRPISRRKNWRLLKIVQRAVSIN
jgi:small subunit ribosomal protein S17